jgi:predicted MFS family arabinose efflux permease
MGGVGSIVAFLFGGILADLNENLYAPFVMGSTVMLFALVMLLLFVREPDSRIGHEQTGHLTEAEKAAHAAEAETEKAAKAAGKKGLHALQDWPPGEKRSLVFLLLAIFFWFCGYNAVETFFTLFATNSLGVSPGKGTQLLTMFSLSFVAFALPSGILAGRIGRKKVILVGLVGMVAVFLPMLFCRMCWWCRSCCFWAVCSGPASTSTRSRWWWKWPPRPASAPLPGTTISSPSARPLPAPSCSDSSATSPRTTGRSSSIPSSRSRRRWSASCL